MGSDTSIFRGTKFNIKIATRGAFQRKLFGEGRPAQPHGRFRHSYIHTQKWYGELDGGGGGPASRSLHTKINAVPPQLRRLTEVKDWSTDCIIDEMNLKSCESPSTGWFGHDIDRPYPPATTTSGRPSSMSKQILRLLGNNIELSESSIRAIIVGVWPLKINKKCLGKNRATCWRHQQRW